MKIGIDCRLWNESGVGRYTRNLVKNLLELDKNNNYVLFVRNVDCNEVKNQISKIKNNWKMENGNWKIVIANIRWHSFEEQIRFPSIINKENLDLMHFPYFSVPILYNKPFVVTVHDLIIHHYSTGRASTLPVPFYWIKNLSYRFIIDSAAKCAMRIMVPSQSVKKDLIDTLKIDEDKIKITYEGVDEMLNSKLRFQNSGMSVRDKKYFLYVGNAYPHKNLDRLIDAFLKLNSDEKYKHIELFLVGKDDYFYKKLERKFQGKQSIIFFHDVSDRMLHYLYNHAVCLIAPSLMEGFGLTVLEAMASSCLVAASDIPSFKEVCHDACLYFNPKEINNMTKTLQSILNLDKDAIARYKKLGEERASLFSWKKMAEQTLDIYESCSSALRRIM